MVVTSNMEIEQFCIKSSTTTTLQCPIIATHVDEFPDSENNGAKVVCSKEKCELPRVLKDPHSREIYLLLEKLSRILGGK